MPYIEVELDKIDSNPFQTRGKYDEETALSIGTSVVKTRHGLLQAPLARLQGDRYQLAFGHGRVAGLRAVGVESVTLRVEDLTDSEMKKYVLVENVNRSDLTDGETWEALEQFRLDRGWTGEEHNFQAMMANETGIDANRIGERYRVKPILDTLKLPHGRVSVSFAKRVIPIASQYDVETAAKILEWGLDKDWGSKTLDRVQQALRKFDESVFKDMVKHRPASGIIEKLTETIDVFTPEEQKQILKEIRVRRYNEADAITFIDRVAKGEEPQTIQIINEYEEVMADFVKTMRHIKTWGAAQYGILGDAGWRDACAIFSEIERHMANLKLMRWDEP